MKKGKLLSGGILTMGLMMGLSTAVFASAPETRTAHNSTLPSSFISYSTGVNTDWRYKDDYTYHYVKNESGVNLWVVSYAPDGSDQTRGGHAIVPTGEYFVTNFVKEHGYPKCRLNVSTSTSGTTGTLKGAWSPDSVGSYPVVN